MYDPQEENFKKEIAFVIKGGKITAGILQKAFKAFLSGHKRKKEAIKNEKAKNKAQQKLTPKGKQSLKKLTGGGQQVQSVDISKENIGEFDRSAKKFGVGYALKKDLSKEPPEYIVIFKAKDTAMMTAAFKDFTVRKLNRSQKPSIISQLKEIAARLRETVQRTKERCKKRGEVL
jgi:hypothetical protein